ncbi:MAG TPA: PhaM family polyhydroxyalkanoate granule multifunctional regulatory protein [Telluria sp.]|nr:PhaM family polyhydroxyalkanoate granule multifunctional regulatory protein [Telluria sp.]
MLKPPASNIPGMTDTLEFVKNLWGNMNIPGAMPGMGGTGVSTDELDKKIADMKAVEAWLNMNLSMLRGTIQALEVQRNTIATLKSMGESMAQAMGQGGDKAPPFAQFFAQATQPTPQPDPAKQEQASAEPNSEPPPAAAAMPAAVAWWNLLQDQFKQAVTSAMSPEAMAGAAAMAQDAAKRFAEAATPPPAGKADAAPAKENGNQEGGAGSAQPATSKPRAPRAKPEKS